MFALFLGKRCFVDASLSRRNARDCSALVDFCILNFEQLPELAWFVGDADGIEMLFSAVALAQGPFIYTKSIQAQSTV